MNIRSFLSILFILFLHLLLEGYTSRGMGSEPDITSVRDPILAGAWYPGNKHTLSKSIKEYLAGAEAVSLAGEIKAVIGAMPLSDLLEFLLDHRQHIVLVIDEYGGTEGLVTLEDVVETLLGMEIVDEADETEDMQALARRKWAKRVKALGLEVDTSKQGQAEQDAPADADKPGH